MSFCSALIFWGLIPRRSAAGIIYCYLFLKESKVKMVKNRQKQHYIAIATIFALAFALAFLLGFSLAGALACTRGG